MMYTHTHPPIPSLPTGAPWLLRPASLDLYISPGAVAEIIAELRTLPHHHLRRQHEKGQQVRKGARVWVGGTFGELVEFDGPIHSHPPQP